MVTEGIDGGIRPLRHMVLAQAVRRHAKVELESCYSKMLAADHGCCMKCVDRMAAMIQAADPERRPLTGRDVFFSWQRTAEAYIGALVGELVPVELA